MSHKADPCPVCQAKGKTGWVVPPQSWFSTAMHCPQFVDKDGNIHHHDGNSSTAGTQCTNGHRLAVSLFGKCWCGWKGGEDVTEEYRP